MQANQVGDLEVPLPVDAYFDSFKDAAKEADRRRREFAGGAVVVSVQESPYGGYVVRSVPVDMVIDLLTEDLTLRRVVGKVPRRGYSL